MLYPLVTNGKLRVFFSCTNQPLARPVNDLTWPSEIEAHSVGQAGAPLNLSWIKKKRWENKGSGWKIFESPASLWLQHQCKSGQDLWRTGDTSEMDEMDEMEGQTASLWPRRFKKHAFTASMWFSVVFLIWWVESKQHLAHKVSSSAQVRNALTTPPDSSIPGHRATIAQLALVPMVFCQNFHKTRCFTGYKSNFLLGIPLFTTQQHHIKPHPWHPTPVASL